MITHLKWSENCEEKRKLILKCVERRGGEKNEMSITTGNKKS